MTPCKRKFGASLIVAVVVFSGCIPQTRLRYRDDLVEVSEHSVVQILNVHGSHDTEVLKIWGRSFKDVRGRDPCYIRLPERPFILFVTGQTFDGGQATVHLANVSSHEIQSFPAYDSHIGANIGEATSDRFERVARVDGDLLEIEAAFVDARYRYFIDLKAPRFDREEIDYTDSTSGKTHHYVFQTGKRP